jgi:hypothetical protein
MHKNSTNFDLSQRTLQTYKNTNFSSYSTLFINVSCLFLSHENTVKQSDTADESKAQMFSSVMTSNRMSARARPGAVDHVHGKLFENAPVAVWEDKKGELHAVLHYAPTPILLVMEGNRMIDLQDNHQRFED